MLGLLRQPECSLAVAAQVPSSRNRLLPPVWCVQSSHQKGLRHEAAIVRLRCPRLAQAAGAVVDPVPLNGNTWLTRNNLPVLVTVLKAIMGAGGFAMPWAFARMGVVNGALTVFCCATLATLSAVELAEAKAQVEERQGVGARATYVDVALAALGPSGAAVVYGLILACSLGICSAYLAFIATTLGSLLPRVPTAVMATAAAVLVLPIAGKRDFRFLASLAEGGTCAVLLGYAVTILCGFADGSRGTLNFGSAITSWSSWAGGVGPVAFLFCPHFALFQIMSGSGSSASPGRFARPALLAFAFAAVINLVFGAVGLALFGHEVSSIVLNDITSNAWYVTVAKFLLCVNLACSYPLNFQAGRDIVERSLRLSQQDVIGMQRGSAGFHLRARQRLVYVTLVCLTLVMSQLEDFGTLISLVGGVAQASLAFLLPPLVALRMPGSRLTTRRRRTNAVALSLGTALAGAAVAGSIASVLGV